MMSPVDDPSPAAAEPPQADVSSNMFLVSATNKTGIETDFRIRIRN